MPDYTLDQAAARELQDKHHITFDGGFRGFLQDGTLKDGSEKLIPSNYAAFMDHVARGLDTVYDSALVTTPNAALPITALMFQSPKAIKVLLAKRAATEMYDEVKYGTFADELVQWRMDEITGSVSSYDDFANKTPSGTNYNFVQRDNFVFDTFIRVGDRESEQAGKNKIALMADRQKAAYTTVAIAHNKFQLYGVAGKRVYGILNDPNMLPALAPIANSSGDLVWEDKTTKEIFADVIELFTSVVTKSGANVDANTPMTLALAPESYVQLGKATDFNVSVLDMLNKYFKNMKYVSVPELTADDGVNTMRLSVDNVDGQKTGECCITEKMRTFTAVRETSSVHQKVAGGTLGAVIYRPVLVGTMTGI